jgi:putative transposase|tara:strand:+ start:478 stop:648 length:171 start_codon:yes stop_codon:yes gene_type:complete
MEGFPFGDASITCWLIDASMMSQMKAMADENRRLKRMHAEMSMQNDLLKGSSWKKP